MNYLKLLFVLTLSPWLCILSAQTTGLVEYPSLGISFIIPQGWVGQEIEVGYLIGSQSESGFALISTHQYQSIDELREMASQGIHDQAGTSLRLAEALQLVGENGVGGEFLGTVEGQQVTAFVIGLINSSGSGSGVTILVAASIEHYSSNHKDLAFRLAESVKFSKPETSAIAAQWQQLLGNSLLTYMSSYYSSGSGYEGYQTGGGYSDKEAIHLCAQGYFNYESSSSMSIDTGGAFGNSSSGGQGQGNWEVVGNVKGGATLVLKFYNGEIYEYTLEHQDGKTFLNGKRYYRTYGNDGPDYAPNCF